MLSRFRSLLTSLSTKVGVALSKLGLTPNELTIIGLTVAVLTPVTGYLGFTYSVPAMIAASAIFDWLDGAVARATSRVSKLGSFIDSFCDRVSDVAYLIALHVLGVNTYVVMSAILVSLLVSYLRCKAESLGVSLEGVGYVERGERVITIFIASIAALVLNIRIAEYVLLILVILSTLTIIQRLMYVIRVLS